MWTVGLIRQVLQLDTMGIHFELIEPNRVFFCIVTSASAANESHLSKNWRREDNISKWSTQIGDTQHPPCMLVGVSINEVHVLLIMKEAKIVPY